MLLASEDWCRQFVHYVAGLGIIAIGTLILVKGYVEIEGLGITIKGPLARAIGLCAIILGILITASGPFEWCGF